MIFLCTEYMTEMPFYLIDSNLLMFVGNSVTLELVFLQ